MEQLSKRIIAIVLIAVIGAGIGVGAYFLIEAPAGAVWKLPGAPSGIPEEQWIKIGLLGDIGELQGDANFQGGYLAANDVNEAGGIVVGGTTYYIAVGKEDTDESAAEFSTSRAVTAAERMIYKHECDFGIGGFRTESVLAYREPFMENKIIFVGTGAATDRLCGTVATDYDYYKYWFRISPTNSSELATDFGGQVLYFMITLRALYGTDKVDKIGLLVEDLVWTESWQEGFPRLFNIDYGGAFGTMPAAAQIAFDIALTAEQMDAHLQTLEDEGCDVVLIGLSGGAGILLTQQWKAQERPFMLIGSNVQGSTTGYWDDTDGDCEYELGALTGVNFCNKTPLTRQFMIDYYEMWNEDPLYMAFGAYSAVRHIANLIEDTQSFDHDTLIDEWETYNITNPIVAVGGNTAWWPDTHDIAGYPFGYAVWYQWQDGTKILVPSFVPGKYPNTMIQGYPTQTGIGTLEIPPWVLSVYEAP
ncbi:MAG: ABC transporter substrate-binding protein [Candidatus Hodarchaeota archaeon]